VDSDVYPVRLRFHWLVVIAGGPRSGALRRKRHAEIVVEVTIEGRDPRKLPSHAFSHNFDLLDGCSRYNGIARIMIFRMDQNSIDMVDRESSRCIGELSPDPS
jgi:hypothetical protein